MGRAERYQGRAQSAADYSTASWRSPRSACRALVRVRSESRTFVSALRPETSAGTLHHVMAREIERAHFFRATADVLAYLAALAMRGSLPPFWIAFPISPPFPYPFSGSPLWIYDPHRSSTRQRHNLILERQDPSGPGRHEKATQRLVGSS